MDDRQQFWLKQSEWPRDYPGYPFFGRAVQTLGRIMFPTEWMGGEPGTPPPYNLAKLDPFAFFGVTDYVSYSDADYHQNRQVRRLLGKPDIGPPEREKLSRDDWLRGLVLAAKADAEAEPARLHFWHVREAMTDALASGVLSSASWNRDIGQLEPVHSTWWNVEDVSSRFDFCTFDSRAPLDRAGRGKGFRQLFIEEHGLNVLCDAFQGRLNFTVSEPSDAAPDDPANAAEVVQPAHASRWDDALKWARAQLDASPNNKTMTSRDFEKQLQTQFQLSKGKAERVLEKVIDDASETVQKAWKKPGPVTFRNGSTRSSEGGGVRTEFEPVLVRSLLSMR